MRRGAIVVGLLALGAGAFWVPRAGVGAGGAPREDDSRPGARPQAERKLVFREGFAGSRLGRRRWNACHWWADGGCTIASNNELEWYLPAQARVRRGRLGLVAEARPVRGSDGRLYPYRSGMISSGPPPGSTRPKFAFRYGRAEIRARVPAGRGLWSAFWLLPANRESTPEIDVMEILGHRPATVEMHLHYRRGDGARERRGMEWNQRSLRRGWHTFAIDWRPGSLAWLIDGVVRWSVRGARVPSNRMYLVANLAVGGHWPGEPDGSTRFPSALAIDYVKVWR
jgi:beta-glucanase (GH16 family)